MFVSYIQYVLRLYIVLSLLDEKPLLFSNQILLLGALNHWDDMNKPLLRYAMQAT